MVQGVGVQPVQGVLVADGQAAVVFVLQKITIKHGWLKPVSWAVPGSLVSVTFKNNIFVYFLTNLLYKYCILSGLNLMEGKLTIEQ